MGFLAQPRIEALWKGSRLAVMAPPRDHILVVRIPIGSKGFFVRLYFRLRKPELSVTVSAYPSETTLRGVAISRVRQILDQLIIRDRWCSLYSASVDFAPMTCAPSSRNYKKGEKGMTNLRIGDTAPDFEAETTQGTIRFHEWLGDSWGVLFSHPKDFTPVCTTELGYMAKINPEFQKRNVKIIGLSVDPVDNHADWAADIEETQGFMPNYPMIGDTELKVAKLYGMLPAGAGESSEGRTAVDNQTVRTVFVIAPDKTIKLSISYPMSTGRNFNEILRVIDSMQLTAKHKVATPVNWVDGEDVIIVPAVSNEEAEKVYPDGWKTLKPYLRVVPQPK